MKSSNEELKQRIAELEEALANRTQELDMVKNYMTIFNDTISLKINEAPNQKQLESIQRQIDSLIEKSRLDSLGELAAGLAHEISQPLSVITLVMENINYKMEQHQATAEYLKGKFVTISQNVDKIRGLIDHVRTFSRDQGRIMFERVDVNQIILSALTLVETQLRNKQIRFVTELDDNIGRTVGNPSRFEQVLLNLLSNSSDALDEKEKESLSGSLSKDIRIITSREQDRIKVRVWDNGSGISSVNLDKIFNPFFTTKADKRGTGLGLPIVYGIITEMQGNLTARSIKGEFTEITISLPRLK